MLSRLRAGVLLAAGLAGSTLLLIAGQAVAVLPVEHVGSVEKLSEPFSPHWVWVSDAVNERIVLVDLEDGRMLGMIGGGWGLTSAVFPRARSEIYVPETHYSRGSRGDRTDVVTIYDAASLAPIDEVELPPRRAMNPLPSGNADITHDDRFLAVFNMTPATSISIVDLRYRRFVQEISTPGCSMVYAAGDRRFAMLCSDGSMLLVELDESGREQRKQRTPGFFDPEKDPVIEKAVATHGRWLFASFEGMLHEVDLTQEAPRFEEPWSLVSDADRAQKWRVGGRQIMGVHHASQRLFVLMHQGGPDTHKQDGTEIWVYDLARRERVQRIPLHSPGFTYLGVSMEFGQDWIWPFNALYGFLVDQTLSEVGIGEIAVTQDEQPRLVTAAPFTGSLAIYDALSGEFIERMATGNMTNLILQAPPWPIETPDARAPSDGGHGDPSR